MIAYLLLILNIFMMEALLSVDNAAVLAIMVGDLPQSQRVKALRYGILGAFVFRGTCLFIATYIIQFSALKFAGGFYLWYLVYNHFKGESDDEVKPKKPLFSSILGTFWATVLLVEVMDIVFSIDNILAVVAMTSNFYIVFIGVALGIISMRFVAQVFVKLLERYPSLERSAYILIGVLGLRLIIDGCFQAMHLTNLSLGLASSTVGVIFTLITLAIFLYPIAVGRIRGANQL